MTAPISKPPTKSPYSYTPARDDSPKIIRWARILLTVALIPIGLRAFRDEYGYVPLISDINTAVHEFGHMLFIPFGETMMFLGGSLTQVAFPALFVTYFLFGKRDHRDLHAAMVCVWWTSINVVSVAIYAADARARQLMLLSGATGQDDDSGHDFYNLFSRWGVLERDTMYASGLRSLAWLMFLVSILVGFWAALRVSKSGDPVSNPH